MLSTWPLSHLRDREGDSLAVLQGTEAVQLNHAVVDENVGPAVIRNEEAVPFLGVPPLHKPRLVPGRDAPYLFALGTNLLDLSRSGQGWDFPSR